MPNTFEQTVAALVENRVAAEHPTLGQYRRGFTLLDFDEDKQTAFGLYRYLIGTVPALMPCIYRSGELSGLDILILRDLKLFVPAIDSWISMIADSGIQDMGELLPDKGPGKGPSGVFLQLRNFPYMLKTAEAELSPAENSALCSGITGAINEEVLRSAMADNPLETWLRSYPKGAALVAKAAASDPFVAEVLGNAHGDRFMADIRKAMLQTQPLTGAMFRKASPEPLSKVSVITDIGSPEAASLRPSEKRILLQTGQFIVDHRAETETTLVIRSPDSGVFQTCPKPGRWRLLTQDGDLVEVCTHLPFDTRYRDTAFNHMADETGRRGVDPAEFWVVPKDGSKPFRHRADDLYVRDSNLPLGEGPEVGMDATRENVIALLRKPKTENLTSTESCGCNEEEGSLYGELLFVCKGYANTLYCRIEDPNDAKSPIVADDRSVVFTGTPGAIRNLGDRYMIPQGARVFGMRSYHYSLPSLRPGRPMDIKDKFTKQDDIRELAVELRDGLVSLSGAVNRKACGERQAVLDLVRQAGVHAQAAATMVREAKSRPGVRHGWLLRMAAYRDQDEDQALGGINVSIPIQTRELVAPSTLEQGGARVANAVRSAAQSGGKAKDDSDLDAAIIKQVLSLADFREIAMDSVRKFTTAMDEAGKMLLRVLVHKNRYEDRYGEDADALETNVRDAFTKNGDLALFLREKKGRGGYSDAESALAGLLTEDMG